MRKAGFLQLQPVSGRKIKVALLLFGRLEYSISRKIDIISLSVIDLYKSMAKNKYALDFPVHISNVHTAFLFI